ncbi:hypothetical protein F4604DRAFT_1925066 [Suillus subluteus]|nr:hypothetical protein F4604DRAFT_1925066 [Suillus subluteus]
MLDGLWKDNPAFAPVTILSVPGIDHASGMAALISGKGKPPLVPSPVGGESAAPDVLPDGIPNAVAQGKGKEKAPPIPDFDDVDESMDFLDDADTHNVPPIQSSTLGCRHSDNFVTEHAMDEQEAEEPLDEVFEPDGQEDGYTILCTHTASSTPSPSASHTSLIRKPGTARRTSQKSGLSQCLDAEMEDVKGQVQSLTDAMSYIYTAKAAALEYKIAKVNANRHQHDIEFQREQAEKECGDAAVVHQCTQEAKALKLQVLEAQARVQAEKKAALQLEIELLKLKGGMASG